MILLIHALIRSVSIRIIPRTQNPKDIRRMIVANAEVIQIDIPMIKSAILAVVRTTVHLIEAYLLRRDLHLRGVIVLFAHAVQGKTNPQNETAVRLV
jgi:hypothetical protein